MGLEKGYERVFDEEFGPKRKAGSNCALLNTCTFWGDDNERSASNGSLYVFAGSTLTKKINFFVFVNQSYGSLDFDFRPGPRYPRVSIPAVTPRDPKPARLCKEPILPTLPPLPPL